MVPMKPTLLISSKVLAEFGDRINGILARAPRPLALLPFTPELQLTPEAIDNIEAVYYSRDIWEGTEKSVLRACEFLQKDAQQVRRASVGESLRQYILLS